MSPQATSSAQNTTTSSSNTGGANQNDAVHKLYHEAQKRAGQPQPTIKHRKPGSLLLTAPNNIIFELFNTIIKQTSAESLLDFVSKNLKGYLDTNWSAKITQQALRRLRREQALDVRAGLTEAPAIRFGTGVRTAKPITTIIDARNANKIYQQQSLPRSPQQQQQQQAHPPGQTTAGASPPGPGSPNGAAPQPAGSLSGKQRSPPIARTYNDKQSAIDQIFEHIMWRVQTDNVTQITSLLIKLVLDDGYKSGKLKAEAFADVQGCFQDWRSQKLIKLYAYGSAPANDQKLILANTTAGDLTKWVANYIDGTEKRQRPELIRILATALRDKTKNCIYVTHELIDAMNSIETGVIRCVFLVDRQNHYEPITSMPHYSSQIEPLILSGKLYVMSSLDCVEFAPDPTSPACC